MLHKPWSFALSTRRGLSTTFSLSKLNSNLLLISPDPVQPVALVKNALQMYKAYLRDARVEASFSIYQSYHNRAIDYVLLGPARLLQVLINFLTNAIKFTRDSRKRHITILLGASLKQPSSGPGKCHTSVAENLALNNLLGNGEAGKRSSCNLT